jgi:putative peptidoglycan lipid II flippase
MFLRAGILSLVLLLASRVLGLLRETAQAAAFGASSLGDLAVLMFTLPDLLASIFLSGALSYVLLPAWAKCTGVEIDMLQRRLAGVLFAGAAIIFVVFAVLGGPLGALLAASAVQAGEPVRLALLLGAAALALALLAALWTTRLQHERDFVGMYGANLVVNAVLVFALFFIAARADFTRASGQFSSKTLWWLGAALLAAGALRLLWLHLRLPKRAVAGGPLSPTVTPPALPPRALWLWAGLSAGLPLVLVLVARSVAAGSAAGALASFNYAWKLVELPLVLAVQLVASLALPALAQALTRSARTEAASLALLLAWALACAALAALLGFAQPLAQLLYGYGRMDAAGLARVAQWAALGAWSLPAQAVLAVLTTLLASEQRMKPVALLYALAAGVVLVAALVLPLDGRSAMLWLSGVLSAIAVATAVLAQRFWQGAWPWRAMLAPLAVAVGAGYAARQVMWSNLPLAGVFCAGAAILVVASAYATSPQLQAALRRKRTRTHD